MRAILHNASKDISKKEEVLLILGDGDSMKQDLDEFLSWKIPHDVAALGRAIKEYPGHVRHWVNGDGESAVWWAKNLVNGNGTIKHTLGPVDGFDADWDMEQDDYNFARINGSKVEERIHGSSALLATLIGIALDYKRIVLAGCPLDQNGHWYFPEKKQDTLGPVWLGVDFMAWLDFSEQEEAERVRSMSGYTLKIMGQAGQLWLSQKG